MGKLYVVGIGPGNQENMTELAKRTLEEADIIVGYTGYIKLLHPYFSHKNFYDTGMRKEVERCEKAIELAKENDKVAIVSSGDSGVYGMASLILELVGEKKEVEVEVIPGVTAALSGAALLGAPLSHDFVVISLSDLLTSWGTIEKRLRAAAKGDFSICLYNPGSRKRAGHLGEACQILMETLPKDRPCGIARNIGRDGQSVSLMTLEELSKVEADMTETIFIGNSQTLVLNKKLVTPRGYKNG